MPVPLSDRPARWRATLAGPRPVTGMWVASGSPVCAEICAGAGFDWLLIDSEHAPNDLRSILAQLQGAAPYPVTPWSGRRAATRWRSSSCSTSGWRSC